MTFEFGTLKNLNKICILVESLIFTLNGKQIYFLLISAQKEWHFRIAEFQVVCMCCF